MKFKFQYAKVLFSILFITVLVKFIQGGTLKDLLVQMDPLYLLLSVSMSVLMIVVSCLKWRLFLGIHRNRKGITFLTMLKYYFMGYYFSNLLPSNIGGDLVRSYMAGKRIDSQSHAAVSVFLERFTGIICLLLLALFSPLVKPSLYVHPAIWIPAAAAAGGLILIAVMLFVKRPVSLMDRGVMRVLQWIGSPARILSLWATVKNKLDSFHEKLSVSLGVIKNSRSLLLGVSALTALFYALTWLNVFLAFKTFGVPVEWLAIIAVTPAAMLVAMIPLAPLGSLGLMEASFAGYFLLVGVDITAGTVMSLLLRFKMILIGAVGFLFFIQHRGEYDRQT